MMKLPATVWATGTDGIRGRVGEDPITPDFMLSWLAVGMAFREMGACRILVGGTPVSGYMFESHWRRVCPLPVLTLCCWG